MAQDTGQSEEKVGIGTIRYCALIFGCTIAANISNDLGWFRPITGLFLAYTIGFLIVYWIPPRLTVRYMTWVTFVLLYALVIWLGWLFLPVQLSRWMRPALAYALPTFILFIVFYFLPPMLPAKKKPSILTWTIMTIVATLFFGWIGQTGGLK